MARVYTGNVANYLSVSATPVTGYPVTVIALVRVNNVTAGTQKNIIRIGHTTVETNGGIALQIEAGDVAMYGVDGTGYPRSLKSGVTASTWVWVAGTATQTERVAYLNGAAGTPNTTSVSWSSPQATHVGAYIYPSGSVNPMDGDIAELAVWDVLLTPGEIGLAGTVNMKRIRPGSLKAYWTLSDSGTLVPEVGSSSLTLSITGTVGTTAHTAPPAFVDDGTLSVLTTNPRYLTRDGQRAFFLGGSHTWFTVVDYSPTGIPSSSEDWESYYASQRTLGASVTELWVWDHFYHDEFFAGGDWYLAPLPYSRTGPGNALDGNLKFDLTSYNSTYFDRIRSRLQWLASRGMYGTVLLFETAIASFGTSAWTFDGHPYNASNNINSVAPGSLAAIYDRSNSGVNTAHQGYVDHLLDTIEDLPNVIVEIANEPLIATSAFSEFWVNYVRDYEIANSTFRHPIYRSTDTSDDSAELRACGADIISPAPAWSGYASGATPEESGGRVIILDTDHITPLNAARDMLWRAFTRGDNVLYMDDPWLQWSEAFTEPVQSRTAAAQIAHYAGRLANLALCVPNGALASTNYCLANPGVEYVVYQPSAGSFTVDLSASTRTYTVEWLDTATGLRLPGPNVVGGSAAHTLVPPFGAGVVAFLQAGGSSRQPSVTSRPRGFAPGIAR